MTTKEEVMEYFRFDNHIEEMNKSEKYEIALDCLRDNEDLYNGLTRAFDEKTSSDRRNTGTVRLTGGTNLTTAGTQRFTIDEKEILCRKEAKDE